MPTYYEMAKAAILSLKERTGSSTQAIKSYIEANFDVDFKPHLLRSALKKAVDDERLLKVKASYKLSPAEKKPVKAPKPKAAAAKKPAAKKTTKKPAKKKTTTKKKAAPKKTTKKTTKKKTTKKTSKKK
mmetsp:Transcript_16802/g.63972  ORF Transcript_16802/g.63972 Transcript_16802/m.63972 type:complete len:129 (-) Transcript_16802:407-793(-)